MTEKNMEVGRKTFGWEVDLLILVKLTPKILSLGQGCPHFPKITIQDSNSINLTSNHKIQKHDT